MSKVLNKIKIANPLYHFNLSSEVEEYENIKTDVELVNFFHKMWGRFENQRVITDVLLAMMSFSVGTDINHKVNTLIQ